jgi:hypothetical protein
MWLPSYLVSLPKEINLKSFYGEGEAPVNLLHSFCAVSGDKFGGINVGLFQENSDGYQRFATLKVAVGSPAELIKTGFELLPNSDLIQRSDHCVSE